MCAITAKINFAAYLVEVIGSLSLVVVFYAGGHSDTLFQHILGLGLLFLIMIMNFYEIVPRKSYENF